MAIDDKPQALDQAFIDGMRQRIRVADIIDQLQNHVLDRASYPMSQTQIRAAEVLLKKSIPDLQQTEIKGGKELGAAFAAAVRAANGIASDII